MTVHLIDATTAELFSLAIANCLAPVIVTPPSGHVMTELFNDDGPFHGAESMFDNEIAINQMLIRQFKKTVVDIPEDVFFHPGLGHGHPPIWIIGHLAIVGEMAQRMIGGSITHPEWLSLFGPASSDIVSPQDGLDKPAMVAALVENYQQLRDRAAGVDESVISQPHNVGLFEGTTIKTVGHCVSLILTNHFGFHLAQLSSCRRTAGFGPLF